MLPLHTGDEPSGRQVLVQWAEWMCSDYGTDPEVTDMVERFHVMLLPSMNPDGFDAQQRVNHDKKVRANNNGSHCRFEVFMLCLYVCVCLGGGRGGAGGGAELIP